MTRDDVSGSDSLLKYADLLLRKGMQEEAGVHLQELLRRDPNCAKAHYLLAVVRMADGSPEQAAHHFQEALRCAPGEVKALNGLGVVLGRLGRIDEAVRCLQAAVRNDPRYQDAAINLALLFKDHGCLCDAEWQLEDALALQPEAVRLRYNLANVLHLQGRSLEAVAAYRETLRLDPKHLDAQQNLLFALHYSPRFSDDEIHAEHLAAAAKEIFRPGAINPGRAADPLTGRRIKIGYLSPDFRCHSVASFIEPVLSHHDRGRFEIFCYANLADPDPTTERLRGLAEHWRDIRHTGDEEAARVIVEDRIDILIDLAGHTSGNRLPLLARKPAPLQVTWLGYPDTTGIPELDFRITDRFADPPGMTEAFNSERLIRLEPSFCCYLPPEPSPPVGALPALAAGRITFGSFNNLAKVSPEVIALWSRVLHAVPDSRLLLKCRPLGDPGVGARILQQFLHEGVTAGQVELHPGNPSPAEHLAQYHRVDIALDTFPYNGTTTSCEALWMGVPVVTLAGTRHAGRTGVSILTNCGLEWLVAREVDEYVAVASALAQDLVKLRELRAGLRQTLRHSPLMDGPGVTRELEAALVGMLEESLRR